MSPGYKTTEFWVAVFAALGSLAGYFPGWGGPVAFAAYAISRGLTKSNQ